MDRREFLKSAAFAAAPPAPPAAPFNGIQMGAHTILDEGFEPCLDLIQDTARINCVMVYSSTYHSDVRKPPQLQATDHGVPPRPTIGRKLPKVWFRPHDSYYRDTPLRHQKVDSSFEYADRDLFKELLAPIRRRGMKLYARILEG